MSISLFQGKSILLGVTGSIAAYKAVDLASKLTQAGAFVDVILTQSAEKFVSPLSFQSVTGRKAYTDKELWGGEGHVVHVGLGHPAEMVIIAPVSANTIAKLAHGIADNLLTVAALAAVKCPLVLAPAMDAGMYSHPATQKNVDTLKQRGAFFIGPAEGHLASGLVGLGRFVEPVEVLNFTRWIFSRQGVLQGKRFVISAGGTQEPIDPVRIITNRSSGKQGYALAQAALDQGAEVTLISAPTALPSLCGAAVKPVVTAKEMLDAVILDCQNADCLIMAAAVADFTPTDFSNQKMKKVHTPDAIGIQPTTDILLEVAKIKRKSGFPQIVVGFAAESQALEENALKKLHAKSLDMIVANDITEQGSGFSSDTNRVILFSKDGTREALALQSKIDVAEFIIKKIAANFSK